MREQKGVRLVTARTVGGASYYSGNRRRCAILADVQRKRCAILSEGTKGGSPYLVREQTVVRRTLE